MNGPFDNLGLDPETLLTWEDLNFEDQLEVLARFEDCFRRAFDGKRHDGSA